MDNICIEGKLLRRLTFNPGLMLTGFRTTRPRSYKQGYKEQERTNDVVLSAEFCKRQRPSVYIGEVQTTVDRKSGLPANLQSEASIEQNNHGDVKKFHRTLWLY